MTDLEQELTAAIEPLLAVAEFVLIVTPHAERKAAITAAIERAKAAIAPPHQLLGIIPTDDEAGACPVCGRQPKHCRQWRAAIDAGYVAFMHLFPK